MDNKRVLIIDDEDSVLATYRLYLGIQADKGEGLDDLDRLLADVNPVAVDDIEDGFELTLARQGEEGVALVEQGLQKGEQFAIAFIDMRMPPGMDGVETARAIRALDPDIYIVFVTAFNDHSAAEIHHTLRNNVLLLKKPFNEDEISLMAATLCGSWTATEQRRVAELRLQHALRQFVDRHERD